MPADATLAAVVTLRPLREDEYREWDTAHRRGYEHGLVDYAGMERDAARAKVERDVAAVLPEGLATPGTWIWAVEADGRPVGAVFLGLRGADAWLYDVTIHAPDRGRGYGRAAMLPLEEELRVLGTTACAERGAATRSPPRALPVTRIIEESVHMRKRLARGAPRSRTREDIHRAIRRRACEPTCAGAPLDELVVEPDAAIRGEDEEREPDAGYLTVDGHPLPIELDDVCDAVDVVWAPKVKPSRATHPW